MPKFKEKLREGVKIPDAFACDIGDEEAYHFKDIGWIYLNKEHDISKKDRHALQKFKRGINALGIKHKYPLPEELKD